VSTSSISSPAPSLQDILRTYKISPGAARASWNTFERSFFAVQAQRHTHPAMSHFPELNPLLLMAEGLGF
jgi:hypothetical protein